MDGCLERYEQMVQEISEYFDMVESRMETAITIMNEKECNRLLFGSIVHTKGKTFKSQVQLNKPKFIQARSRL